MGLTRRQFLSRASASALGLAALGTAPVLVGCGGRGPETGADTPTLVQLYSSDRVITAGTPQRIPFAIVGADDLDLADGASLEIRVVASGTTIDTVRVPGRVVAHDHVGDVEPDHRHADLLRYYPLRTTLPEPGIYDLVADLGQGRMATLPVQAFSPSEVEVVGPGQPMPSLVTPTVADPAGISPVCTRVPACGLHTVSLDQALASGRPVALLVASPARCQTAYCGPVLDTLVAGAPTVPEVVAIHLEVYANAAEVGGNDADLRLAAQVRALGLTFEPSLFLIGRTGTVVDRLDNVYDDDELARALASIA